MMRQAHKRSQLRTRAVVAAAALLLGGGGTAVIAQHASAGASHGGGRDAGHGSHDAGGGSGGGSAAGARTLACPDVGDRLRDVPAPARTEVSRGLSQLDAQVAQAYERMTSHQGGEDTVLDELKAKRAETIGRINDSLTADGAGPAPATVAAASLSGCRTEQVSTAAADDSSRDLAPRLGARGMPGGPSRADFADIRTAPLRNGPRARPGGSTGTFTSVCGRNENGHFNPDNVIVTPGVRNGAHHMHDYVGNKSTDAFSTDASLAAAGTTCANGDKSSHYWPVLRVLDGKAAPDANAPGGGHDGNMGTVLRPASVTLQFRGSPVSKVTAMPRFLRIITGDAKALTNGVANANASWSCEGFENRQLKDKYPICPKGADVVRTFAFQNCWDGRNTDSANHRTHVAFARPDGSCPRGFRAVPQLVQRITYDVPAGVPFAVDSFPEQLHKPVTDHGDFINVMSDRLMAKAASCVNDGRTC
ncbi:hypothetical protein AF335_21265 [Streptomyces eurocidicus]|uniref:DUF1996 domain-containing protein n=1 Tax=Streptomyces eurocidicus TaxID=66423 RepID=A0A2N8NU10_STREU|nr:DUF1996 domain-containing protein [Streptomyces eurocidicus]MBB5119283.1 hypothetical protein [Streptomyces eurocidicus]MBF6053132.1 DUF1996 domain-containing protein [Streptomyces eurocidicus]PNE32234.1 hypothetical protein AF335_21265 [Streptomyces eurocidicus]